VTDKPLKINSLEWHKNNLFNIEQFLKKQTERAEIEQKRALDTYKDWSFYSYQIGEAENEGRDSFDRDKYRIKRKKQ